MSSNIEQELAESNRRVQELAAALEEERRRAASVEAALSSLPAESKLSQQEEEAARTVDWGSAARGDAPAKIYDARMFMAPHPVLTERAAYRAMPSVVTWLQPSNLLDQASRFVVDPAGTSGVASYAVQGSLPTSYAAPEDETDLDVDVEAEELRDLREHESYVWCCALHPLVPLVATGSGDRTIRLWRLDGECLRILRGHREWVYCVAFDPMGDILCSGSFDGTLRLWSVSSGECIRIIGRQGVGFHTVAFQPGSGAFLAAGTSEKVVRLFRVADGEVARTFAGHTNAVTCLAFQPPAGRLLVTGSVDCSLRVWHVDTGRCVQHLGERSRAKVWCCAFDNMGELVASGGSDCLVRVWRVKDGSVLSTLSGHKGVVRSVAFHPVVRGLVASGEGNLTWGSDNSVRLWLIGDGRERSMVSPDGRQVEATCKAKLMGHFKMVTAVAFPPDGSLLVTCSRDASVRFWAVSCGSDLSRRRAAGTLQRFGVAAAMHAPHVPGAAPVGSEEPLELKDFSAVEGLDRLAGGADSDAWQAEAAGERGPGESAGAEEWTGAPPADMATAERDAAHLPSLDKVKASTRDPIVKSAAAAGKIASQIKVVTSRASKVLPKNITKPLVSSVSSLWKGSLFSEDEMELIRKKRENEKTDDEKAHDLYWSMYKQREKDASDAFVEVALGLQDDPAAPAPGFKPGSAEDISSQLKALSNHLSAPLDPELTGGGGPPAADVAQQEVASDIPEEDKSEDLIELERLVEEQRAGRAEFAEKLQDEKQALEELKLEVEQRDASKLSSDELKALIKAATYSGYRLAELKRSKEEEIGGSQLLELQEQRSRFERFVREQREELRMQTDKAQELLEQIRQKEAWDLHSHAAMPTMQPYPSASGIPHSGSAAMSFYRKPLPHGLVPLSSPHGRELLQSVGEDGETMALRALEVCAPADAACASLSALAIALNALHVDNGRMWPGPWRWYSVWLLRKAVSPDAGFMGDVRELAAMGPPCGVQAIAQLPGDSNEDAFRAQLKATLRAENPTADPGCAVVGFACEQLGLDGDAGWACVAALHDEHDMCLLVDGAHAAAWVPLSTLWKAVCSQPKGAEGAVGTGFVLLRRDDERAGLFSRFCLRGLEGDLPPMQDFVMLLETIAPKVLEGTRDPGSAISALIGGAMSRGRLVHVLRQYELVMAHGSGVEAAHAAAMREVLDAVHRTPLYLRVELVLQDELVRSGIGSWRASRASAELLAFFFACADPALLFPGLPATLRAEMHSLHQGVCACSPAVSREVAVVRAHVTLNRSFQAS